MTQNVLKRRSTALIAAGLIVLGAGVDRLAVSSFNQPGTAAAATTSNTTTASTSSSTFASTSASTSALASASAIDQATEKAYNTAAASVVYVVSQGVGSGSGIIYDTKGDIVTNNHVIDGATGLTVTLNNGHTYTATVVGTDRADDLAVIRIHAPNLTPARFASASGYHIAETVLAIGSPLGLQQSVTSGLISGLHRVEQEQNGAYISNAIQTSAPINPGNSGGALVALDGTVVGIPTLEQTSSSSGTSAQNVGFAIPSERVVLIARQLVATGKVQHTGRPYLGLSPTDASSRQSQFGDGYGFGQNGVTPTTSGALVSQIASNGPAAAAGIQQGDVITGVNGTSISDAQGLLTVLAQEKPGNTISLKIDRNGTTMTVTVYLGELQA